MPGTDMNIYFEEFLKFAYFKMGINYFNIEINVDPFYFALSNNCLSMSQPFLEFGNKIL